MTVPTAKPEILCVDDEKDIVDSLERLLRKECVVHKATSGQQGLDILKSNANIALIISDQRMPKMTGVEFLEKSQKTHPLAVRILLTGYTDIESVISAINSGQIFRYINKPWDPNDLALAVNQGLQKFLLQTELKQKNIELEAALADLRSLDSAKNHFMALVNHELKTPLTAISSYTQLLIQSSLDEEQRLYVSKIQNSTDRLTQIILDVIDIVSAETGQTLVKKQKFTFQECLTALPHHITDSVVNKEQVLEVSGENLEVQGDKALAFKVVQRLLHNATKFGDKKSTISFRVSKDDSDVYVHIHNKGKNINQQDIAKILRPFTIIEDVMNHTGGLGLGLTLAQALLKRMQSTLKIESQKNSVNISFVLRQQ